MNLFQLGNFTLHSGQPSRWKIEMDALTPDDWGCLAVMMMDTLKPYPAFSEIIGVPRGGLPLARAFGECRLAMYPRSPRLIVDDVLTTGKSITALMQPGDLGWVVFARGPCPPGVRALFYMPEAVGEVFRAREEQL